jgi:hypothetical protein
MKKISKLDKDQLTKILTDAFLGREDLNKFTKEGKSNDVTNNKYDIIPLQEKPDLFKSFKLLNKEGDVVSYKTRKDALPRLKGLNATATDYQFDVRKTTDGKWRIFPLRPVVDAVQQTLFNLPSKPQKGSKEYTKLLTSLETKLIRILKENFNISVKEYEDLTERLGVDALGLTELLVGDAEIGIKKFRERDTLPEEAGHVFIALITDTPLYNRLMSVLDKDGYYKVVLEDKFDQYDELYKQDVEKLKVEAAGQLLGKTFITKELNPTGGTKNLLDKIWNYVKNLIKKFSINDIQRELDELTGEIADSVMNEQFDALGAKLSNIKPFNNEQSSTLFDIRAKIKTEQLVKDRALSSIKKRIQHYKRKYDVEPFSTKNADETEDAFKTRMKTFKDRREVYKKNIEEYNALEVKYNEAIDEGNYLKGITLYMDTLQKEQTAFTKQLQNIRNWNDNVSPDNLKSVASTLRDMIAVVNNNESTLDNLVKNLGDLIYTPGYEFSEEADALRKTGNDLKIFFNGLKEDYIRIGTQLTAELMKPLLGKRNDADILSDLNRNRSEKDKLKTLDIEEALQHGTMDIGLLNRWLDSITDAPDELLRIIGSIVEDRKIIAQQKTLEDKKDLLDAQDALKQGGSSTDIVVENYKGIPTGYFVCEGNWGEWYEERNKFFTALNAEIKNEYGVETYAEFKKTGSDENVKGYKNRVSKFYSKYIYNSIVDPFTGISETDEVLRNKQEILSEEEYKLWFHFNVRYDDASGRPVILRHKNKQYADIMSDPAKKDYYLKVLKLKLVLDSFLPEKMQHGHRLPQIRKDFLERLKMASKDGSAQAYKNIFSELKENFQVMEDEDRRGMKFMLSDDQHSTVKFLPIYYISKLQNPSEISTDITSSMLLFSSMVRDYAEMNEIVDLLEITRDVVNVREIIHTDSKGNPVVESIKTAAGKLIRPLVLPQGESNISNMLSDFMDMIVYGELEKEEKIKGTNIDMSKIVDLVTRYAALNMLSLNVFSGFQNVITGTAMERIDAIAGEFVGVKSLKYADVTYAKETPDMMGAIGSLDGKNVATGKHSKALLWTEAMDVMQDYKSDAHSLDASRKTIFGRLFKTSTLMFIQKAGENYLNVRTSLALAYEYRYDKKQDKFVWEGEYYARLKKLNYNKKDEIKSLVKSDNLSNEIKEIEARYADLARGLKEQLDSEWKEMVNYYEAHEVVGRRLKLKEGFKDNKEDSLAFVKRTRYLNGKFHGLYDDFHRSAAQQYSLARFAMLFRKYMVPFWNRRYKKVQFSFEGDAWDEGFYTSLGHFIKNLVSELGAKEFSLRKSWASLSDMEKANVKRATVEIVQLLSVTILALVLGSLGGDDDDEKNWALNMITYLASRSITELGAFTPVLPISIEEALRLVQSPSAAINPVKRLLDIMQFWDWNDELERGRFKGWTRGEKLLIQSVPGLNKLMDVSSPEEMMVFYGR